MKRNIVRLLSLLAIVCGTLLAQCLSTAEGDKTSTASGAAHPELVVSTAWLAEHLADPNLVIVHIGHMREDYDAAFTNFQQAAAKAPQDLRYRESLYRVRISASGTIKAATMKNAAEDRSPATV